MSFNKKSAFTLIEAMAVALLVSLVFSGGMAAIIPLMRAFNIERAKVRAADELTLALEWIKRDATKADGFSIGTVSGLPQLYINKTDYADPAHPTSTITYSLDDIGASDTLRFRRIAATTKLMTNMIDKNNLPASVYSGYSGNCLVVDLRTKDPDTGAEAHQRRGITLRCRSTTP